MCTSITLCLLTILSRQMPMSVLEPEEDMFASAPTVHHVTLAIRCTICYLLSRVQEGTKDRHCRHQLGLQLQTFADKFIEQRKFCLKY